MSCVPNTATIPARHGKPAPRARPLITPLRAASLSTLFKVLANDSRLRLLHALERAGEMCVTDLAAEVGMTPQAVSNHLQRLSDRGVVTARRDGVRLYYHLADPCVAGLLDLGMCLLEEGVDKLAPAHQTTTTPPRRRSARRTRS